MTYTYSLVVLDEKGEVVIDRDLTPDQAVQILADALNAVPVQVEPEQEPAAVSVPQPSKPNKGRGRPRADREKVKDRAAKKVGASARGAKPCCGSLGVRHLKTCPELAKSKGNFSSGKPSDIAEVQATTLPPRREPLTRDQYSGVRRAMDEEGEGFSAGRYALTSKLSASEVMSAKRSTDYEDYLAIR